MSGKLQKDLMKKEIGPSISFMRTPKRRMASWTFFTASNLLRRKSLAAMSGRNTAWPIQSLAMTAAKITSSAPWMPSLTSVSKSPTPPLPLMSISM
jgi:hypothetical protein